MRVNRDALTRGYPSEQRDGELSEILDLWYSPDERAPRLPALSGGAPGTVPGVVFALAAGGLRCLNRNGDGFLGYSPEEIFWRDAFELVHEEDLPIIRALISEIVRRPGTSSNTSLRLRDASGGWRRMDASVHNVVEVPGDSGLLVVNLRDASPGTTFE